jgi:hypothetical protein
MKAKKAVNAKKGAEADVRPHAGWEAEGLAFLQHGQGA